jgi:rhamnose transport system permease protein
VSAPLTRTAEALPEELAAPERSGRRGAALVQRLVVARELGIVAALLLLVVVTVIANPRFLSGQNVRDLLLSAAILTVLAAGQTMVVVTRNVDLSVGSVLGLSAYATGTLLVTAPDLPIVVVVLAGMAVGAACGLLNGAIVAVAGVPSLVVTLGTLYAFRGLDSLWASSADRLQINAADLPGGFKSLGTARLLGVPVLFLVAVVVVLLVGYYLRTFRSGRELYGIGSAPCRASRSAGGCSPRSSSTAPSRAWPASSTPPASRRWTPPPAPVRSCSSSPPRSSAGSPSSAAAARSTAPHSARCCSPPSAPRCPSWAWTRSGGTPPSAR